MYFIFVNLVNKAFWLISYI